MGRAFVTIGQDVKMGSRSATNDKALAWAKELGPSASIGACADAAAFGELIVLATLGVANESALRSAGPEKFRGKLVIDTTCVFPPDAEFHDAVRDQAAGSLLIEAAGRPATDLAGQPLDFTSGHRLLRNTGMLASKGLLHRAALEAVQRAR